jgi:hypothetical protein
MWLPVTGAAGIVNKTCTVRLRRILRSAAWRKGAALSQMDQLGVFDAEIRKGFGIQLFEWPPRSGGIHPG